MLDRIARGEEKRAGGENPPKTDKTTENRNQGNEARDNHPAMKREDVSAEALRGEYGLGKLTQSSTIANIVVLATIELWMFLAQFMPNLFIQDSVEFSHLAIFQESSFACYLFAICLPLIFRQVPLKRWYFVGNIVLLVSPVLFLLYRFLLAAGLTPASMVVIAVVSHCSMGFAVGMAFCNWIRLYIRWTENLPIQVAVGIALGAIAALILLVIPADISSNLVPFLPLVIMVLMHHMRRTVRKCPGLSASYVLEGSDPVKADKRLWVGVVAVGFIFGVIFGYVVVDTDQARTCTYVCMAIVLIIAVVMVWYHLRTGKNPGYSMSPVLLLPLFVCGQGMVAIFQESFLPFTFSLVFAGRMLLELILLLQLPRVFQKKQSLNTFFALWLAFSAAQWVGVILRHFLLAGFDPVLFNFISAGCLCLGVCALSYVLSDDGIANVWGLMPIPVTVPRKRYGKACENLKAEYGLTPRETEIMMMVGRGRNGTFIQERLVISKSTYQTHMRNLYKKLDIHSDQELIDLIEDELKSQRAQETEGR